MASAPWRRARRRCEPVIRITRRIQSVAICCALVAAAFLVGLQSALRGIHTNWTSAYGDFAHGYLILVMALWLGWSHRSRLRTAELRPWWPAAVVLAGAMLALAGMEMLSIRTVAQSLVPIVLLAALALVCGRESARAVLPAVALLYFALPVWWVLNPLLQSLTTVVANAVVGISGIPAYVDGNAFHLPAGIVEIASGCSGLNYFMVSLALAYFQGMLHLRATASRVKLLLLAAALALVSNWIRVCTLIWIGYATDMQHYFIRVDHLYFGWVLFLFVVWPMFWYGARLERLEQAGERGDARLAAVASVAMPPSRRFALAAALATVLLLIPVSLRGIFIWNPARTAQSVSWSPLASGDAGHVFARDTFLPGADEERVRVNFEGRSLDLYRVSSPAALGGPDIPNQAAGLFGGRWRGENDEVPATLASGLRLQQQTGFFDGRQYVMWSGWIVAGESVATAMQAKLATLRGAVRLRNDEQLWLVMAPCEGDCTAAQDLVARFIEAREAELLRFSR